MASMLNACDNNLCQNGAGCVQVSGSCTAYTCSCPNCYTGQFCETLLNACNNHACQNGAACVQVSGSCTAYTCTCPSCYTGQFCETLLNACNNHACQNGAACVQVSGSCTAYTCTCPSCYTGQFCETLLNACSNHACQNGAACVQVSGSCTAYTCSCPSCSTGQFCETLLNACTNNACQNGGVCIQVAGSCTAYTCSCPSCCPGQFCETLVNPCSTSPCFNGGTCYRSHGNFGEYVCICTDGFLGTRCEVVNQCSPNPCLNGGICFLSSSNVGEYACLRTDGFFGVNSEDGQSVANITCIGNRLTTAVWHPEPMISDYGGVATAEDLLARIIDMNVTENNVEMVSAEVFEITKKTDEITDGALELTAIILQDVVSLDTNSTTVTSSIVGTVNNLFSIDEDIIMESQMMNQAPTSIILSLEKQLGQVELQNNIYQESMPNVAVLGQMLTVTDVSNNTGLAFGAAKGAVGLKDVTFLQRDSIPNNIQVSIDVPASITTTIMKEKGTDTFRVSVIAYESSKLFQSSQFDRSFRRPNGPVISFSVPGLLESVDLNEPLTTTFIPSEITKGNTDTECVFWNFELLNGVGGWSSQGCRLVRGSADGSDRQYCNCSHLTNFAVLMNFYPNQPDAISEVITKVGLSLSIVGLSLTLLTIVANRKLRKSEPKKILCNLCGSLLGLYIVFIVGIDRTNNDDQCTAVGALLHYFLLSSIFWMSVQALFMYYLFVKIYNAHIPRFLIKASLFGWGAPAVIVLATIFVHVDDYVDNQKYCFLTLGRMYVSVAIPVVIALLFNVTMFAFVMHSLCQRGKFTNRQRKKNEGIRMLQNGISITLVMGLTWVFGFFAIGDATQVINILFCVFNTLQGFLIFMMYCVRNKDVRNYWKRIFITVTGAETDEPPLPSSPHRLE
ncbi:adhesion G-protein coupled receptor G7-like, partial [Anneissia japonica]|uniref:adhesion G-protein coupled receptor G7-like n=1 Tax=Anneissia japonica TaxID=1529436 RepID=UPI0014259229